jgi:hypothetical protein
MVLKMGETDENVTKNAPMYSQMYATMCTYPRVDASIFCKVAKKYRVGMFVPGASYQPSPEKSVENVMSCQRLVPLYKAASDSMLLNLEAIQSHPHGMEMLYKVSIIPTSCIPPFCIHICITFMIISHTIAVE